MGYRFYTVDVFTDRAFGGNQLAVFPDARGLRTEQMQTIAREFNLSETTFVLPSETPDHDFRLRIFSPNRELPFAGHPTVGSAFVLAAAGVVPVNGESVRIVFEEGVGSIPVEIRANEDGPYFTQLTAAKLPEFGPPPPPTEHLAAMLSLSVSDVLDDADDEPQAISCGLPFLCIPLASIDAVKRARLNWEWWEQCLAAYWAPLVYLFSYETVNENSDVHARMFAVNAGYLEDPATGAAATALAGYLAPRCGRNDATVHWTIEQGYEMGRPSIIEVEADIADKHIREVRVGGRSIMISEGTMSVG